VPEVCSQFWELPSTHQGVDVVEPLVDQGIQFGPLLGGELIPVEPQHVADDLLAFLLGEALAQFPSLFRAEVRPVLAHLANALLDALLAFLLAQTFAQFPELGQSGTGHRSEDSGPAFSGKAVPLLSQSLAFGRWQFPWLVIEHCLRELRFLSLLCGWAEGVYNQNHDQDQAGTGDEKALVKAFALQRVHGRFLDGQYHKGTCPTARGKQVDGVRRVD
jgi:hypothetical protein